MFINGTSDRGILFCGNKKKVFMKEMGLLKILRRKVQKEGSGSRPQKAITVSSNSQLFAQGRKEGQAIQTIMGHYETVNKKM